MKKLVNVVFVVCLLISGSAFAVGNGEAFRVIPQGAALCEGLQPTAVTTATSKKLYFKIVNAAGIEVYRDEQLSDHIFTIPTTVKTSKKPNLYSVNGAYWLDQSNYLTINGVYKLNKTATKITSFVLEYIRAGGYDDGNGPFIEYGPYVNSGCTESGFLFSKVIAPSAH